MRFELNNDKSNVQLPKSSMYTWKKKHYFDCREPIIVHYFMGLVYVCCTSMRYNRSKRRGWPFEKTYNYAILKLMDIHDWFDLFLLAVCADNKPLSIVVWSAIAERYSTNLRISYELRLTAAIANGSSGLQSIHVYIFSSSTFDTHNSIGS